jgi:hypothetical protein
MNGVPAKIAQEICVLLENQNGNSGSGQEEPQHHAGGTAPGDAAAD